MLDEAAKMRQIAVTHEAFAMQRAFRIARGVRTAADVVTVQITQAGITGRGECTPYPRYGESIASTIATIEDCRDLLAAGADREAIAVHLPAGAARNAIDCALWDLEARLAGTSVAALAGLPEWQPLVTALTISLDEPAAMAAEAKALSAVPLLKIKVDADDPMARINAVRTAAPGARIIVDPNESWSIDQLCALQSALAAARIAMLEQPVPAAQSEALRGVAREVPICADEAAHTRADLAGLVGCYDLVNIKLDKTGGLSEALAMAHEARALGLGLMVGCMLGTSLAMAPAALLAQSADFVDLDGPYLIGNDRDGGFMFSDGRMTPPAAGFWGSA